MLQKHKNRTENPQKKTKEKRLLLLLLLTKNYLRILSIISTSSCSSFSSHDDITHADTVGGKDIPLIIIIRGIKGGSNSSESGLEEGVL